MGEETVATPERAGSARDLASLVVVREQPFNAESPLTRQLGVITPVEQFYVRNHFASPASMEGWRLEVGGAVARPLSLTLADLLALPPRSLVATMECAGNGRQFLEPAVPGEPWAYGAVSTAEWTGVRLAEVLDLAGVAPDAVEVLCLGADQGPSPLDGTTIRFERSLPLAEARRDDVLLAYAMNGAPLTLAHGAPLRLVVPGWYGMASVKWLHELRLVREPFTGVFQRARYVFDRGDGSPPEPLGWMRPRSLIIQPAAGARLSRRATLIRGFAWSGAAPAAVVEVSVDGGTSWRPAELGEGLSARAWRPWHLRWSPARAGRHLLLSRTRDASGAIQPLAPEWNVHGYGNNAVQCVEVQVDG